MSAEVLIVGTGSVDLERVREAIAERFPGVSVQVFNGTPDEIRKGEFLPIEPLHLDFPIPDFAPEPPERNDRDARRHRRSEYRATEARAWRGRKGER